jgi:hypothetical protein
VLIVVETQPKHAPLVHLIIERGSNTGFIDATIVIRHDGDEANAPHDVDDVHSDFCEGQWYSEADSVVALLDIIDDDHNHHHHHHHIDIETNEVKVVSRRWCVTYDEDDGGISIRHDLLQ